MGGSKVILNGIYPTSLTSCKPRMYRGVRQLQVGFKIKDLEDTGLHGFFHLHDNNDLILGLFGEPLSRVPDKDEYNDVIDFVNARLKYQEYSIESRHNRSTNYNEIKWLEHLSGKKLPSVNQVLF